MVIFIVNRGLISPNCNWWNLSSIFIKDPNGVDLYYKIKDKFGNFAPTNIFGIPMYIVNDIPVLTEILAESPDTFCVGELKYNFFKPFMELNVGVSKGCPWRRRRTLNENVLFTNELHQYANKYNSVISNYLSRGLPTNFQQFADLSKYLVAKIVFGRNRIPDQIFEVFRIANTPRSVANPGYTLPPGLNQFYRDYIWRELQNPMPESMVALAGDGTLGKEELIDQVPHWIFPMGGLCHTVGPRTIVMLANHPDKMYKLVDQLRNINLDDVEQIDRLPYFKHVIMESLRLNNLVTSTFRTLCRDYTFSNGVTHKKGSQYLILNNPVLRDPECFPAPNKFIPERWTPELEDMTCNMTFNQGPQKCPGKDFALLVVKLILVHYFKYSGLLDGTGTIKCNKIDTEYIPQMINPCTITIESVDNRK